MTAQPHRLITQDIPVVSAEELIRALRADHVPELLLICRDPGGVEPALFLLNLHGSPSADPRGTIRALLSDALAAINAAVSGGQKDRR